MPFDFNAWDDDEDTGIGGTTDLSGGLLGPKQEEEEAEEMEMVPYNRGMLGDTISLIGRSGVSVLETLENAGEFFGEALGKDVDPESSASKLRNFSLFKPDIDEYYDVGWLKDVKVLGKSIGSIPSAVESMGPSLAVAGAGFVAGQAVMPFLPVAGGVIGATLASLGIMGTAEYQSTYETAVAGGLSEDEARSLAWKNGAIEGLGESAGDLIGLGPLMKPLTKIAKQGLKPTLKQLLKADAKTMAKDLFKVYAGEQVTEIGQAVSQTHFLRNAGLTDATSLEAALETIIPTMFMTGGFQLGTTSLRAKQRAKLKQALAKDNDADIRQLAADTIAQMIKSEDPDIAEKWSIFAKAQIAKGNEISWDEEFSTFAEELETAHAQPGEVFTDADIINGTVSDRQLAVQLAQNTNRGLYNAFERALLGMNKTVTVPVPEAEDKSGRIQERAEEILEEAEAKAIEKEKQPVPLEVLNEEDREAAVAELEEIGKVLEDPNIPTDVRFRLGNRAMSLRNALSMREAEVSEEDQTAVSEEPVAPAEELEAVAPEEVAATEPVITPEVEEEIQNRKEEVQFIQKALKKGVSKEARKVLEDRLRVAQDELARLTQPEEVQAPEPERGFDSGLQTQEQVGIVLEKLDEALVVATEAGDQETVDRIQTAISNYTKLQGDLPSEAELDPVMKKKVEEDFQNIIGEDVDPEQVLEASEAQGAVKITEASESPIFESERVVDLPSRVIAWSQDLVVATGARTSNIIVGNPKGSDIQYYLLRDLEDKGTWLVIKKVPGQKGLPIGSFDATQAKQQGKDARTMAAEYAVENFREMGSTEWLPGKDISGKNTWSINVPGGDSRITLTEIGKNKWQVEEDGLTVQRELDSGKFVDQWASMSVGQVKEAVEELYGFATSETPQQLYAELLAQRNVPSNMGQVLDGLEDATVGQVPPKTRPKPKALSTRDFYTVYEPVLTPEQSKETRRATIGPRTAKRTMDYNYIGLEMTDEIRDQIKNDIDNLNQSLGETQARLGFRVAEAGGEYKTMIAGIEDNIAALTRISLINNGERIRIVTGVNASGRTIYAREPRIKPRKELKEKDKAKGFREAGKARTEKAAKEVGGKPKSKAQLKREEQARAQRFQEEAEGRPVAVIPEEERAPVAEPVVGQGFNEQQPVTPQPTDRERSELGIPQDEVVRPDTAPFEFGPAREERAEKIAREREKYLVARDVAVAKTIDRVAKGKGRPLTEQEAIYYITLASDIYERDNPFQEVSVMPDLTPEEIAQVEDEIRRNPANPKIEGRKQLSRRQRIIQKQNRLRMPEYIVDIGSPMEQNAWQLLESSKDLPLVKALMTILSKEELESIPVAHDPMAETAYYNATDDYIVLKGDNPFSKVHEAIHAAVYYRLRRSPGLMKQVDELLERFRQKAKEMGMDYYPTVEYAMRNRDEFLSQAMADPVVQLVLESSENQGKLKNMWQGFVDWVRQVLGLPQHFRNELGEALNMITKIAARQRIKQAKFLTEQNIVLPAAPEVKEKVKETDEQRRERIREVQRKARQLNKSQGWLGDSYHGIKDWAKAIFKYSGTFVQPINDALYNIKPKFAAMMRINEAKLSMRNKTQMTQLAELAKKLKGFTEDELSDFKSGWLNPDERPLLEELVKKKGIEKEWKMFTDLVKENERTFLKLGVLSRRQLKENYLPRVVKDPLGLINAMENTPEGTLFSQQLRAERIRIEKAGGIGAFDKAHQEEFIAKMVLNRRYNALPRKGFTKARIFDHVPAHLLEFYHDPIESMIDYVHHANELIFQRELVGVSNRNVLLEELARAEERLEKAKTDEKRAEILQEVHDIANDIRDIDVDTRAAVDKLLLNMDDITDQQRKEVADMINARLNQKGTRGAVRALKNVSLMMTIGNPLSAITQLGDQGFNIMDNGFGGIAGIAKALTGNALVNNFDIENVLREFSKEGGSSDILNKLMDWSQLKRMDTFGKESYMQGLMAGIKGQTFEQFQERFDAYGEFLEGDQDPELRLREAYASIKEGAPNQNALYMMFSELAKRQPVSLSETSQQFLTAGNARIFWILKQFALRSLSSAVQDMRVGFAEGNKAQGIMRAVGLIGLLGLAGAGTDTLKDLLLQRNLESFPDAVINNVMNLLFLNRYSLERGLDQKKPISTLIANNVMLPPVRLADDMVVDVWTTLQGDFSYKTMAHLPMFGRIAFEYTPMGQEAEGKRMRRSILDLAEKGASQGRLSGLIQDFNKKHADAKVTGLEPITSTTIMTARTKK